MYKNLEIKNFKSIKELKLNTKKVNLFIGKPNVGKSNILEALGLFNLPFIHNINGGLKSLVRVDFIENFFYDNLMTNPFEINVGLEKIFGLSSEDSSQVNFSVFDNSSQATGQIKIYTDFSLHIDIPEKVINYKIFKYIFNPKIDFRNKASNHLLPIYGKNLFTILNNHQEIYDFVAKYFNEYGLNLVYDVKDNQFEIQKMIKNRFYKYPYSSIADTIQKMIFYRVAIETNKDSVLIFEEPEANSFPLYTKELASVISSDETNQFFLSTHSPYLLNNLIGETETKDLNLVLVYYEDYQTKIKVFSEEEILNVRDTEEDLLVNLDKYLDEK